MFWIICHRINIYQILSKLFFNLIIEIYLKVYFIYHQRKKEILTLLKVYLIDSRDIRFFNSINNVVYSLLLSFYIIK